MNQLVAFLFFALQAYDAYLKLAHELERLANANLQHGTGTRQEMLGVKSQRLLGQIHLARLNEKQ